MNLGFNLHYITFGAIGVLAATSLYLFDQLQNANEDRAGAQAREEIASSIANDWERAAIVRNEEQIKRAAQEAAATTMETARNYFTLDANKQIRDLINAAESKLGDCAGTTIYSADDNSVRREAIEGTLAGRTSRD